MAKVVFFSHVNTTINKFDDVIYHLNNEISNQHRAPISILVSGFTINLLVGSEKMLVMCSTIYHKTRITKIDIE